MHTKRYHKRLLILAICILFVIVVVLMGYHLLNQKQSLAVSHYNNGSKSQNSNSNSKSTSTGGSGPTSPYNTLPTPTTSVPGGSSNNSNQSSTQPVTPFGQFVSNYGPISYSATNGSNQEESECQTTIGSTCYISFTDGSITQSLKPLLVRSEPGSQDGVASWSWIPSQVGSNGGLTPGQWQVMAIATLNGQQKTATSSIKLNVGP